MSIHYGEVGGMEMLRELAREIEQIPVIDIHSHIRANAPVAENITDIAYYHYIRTELKSAGAPANVLDSDNPEDSKVQPYLERISNTTTSWCLGKILKDIYGIDDPLHNVDMNELRSKIAEGAKEPNRLNTVFDKANVAKVFTTADWAGNIPTKSERLVPTLRVDSLVNEMHLSRTLERLNEASGLSVFEASDLKKAIWAIFDKAVAAGCAAVSASFNPQIDFEEGSRDSADRILSLVLLGQRPDRDDRKALRSYMLQLVLESCAEHGMPFQVMLGIRRPVANEFAISAFDPGMVVGYAELFARYPNVRFDVFTSNETIEHELAVAARNLRNVYLSGYWWYLLFPTHIRKMIRERIEMLPMTKSCGFFSDAYCAEWVYGKVSLVRKELAFVLSQMVAEEYLTEKTAVEVARHYLSGNPKRIYGID